MLAGGNWEDAGAGAGEGMGVPTKVVLVTRFGECEETEVGMGIGAVREATGALKEPVILSMEKTEENPW